MKFLSQDGLAYLWTKIQAKLDALASRITTDETAIAGKVDKVEGKGLSTEDYTTAEKTKLAGVEAGANAYVLPKAAADTLGGIKVGNNLTMDPSTGVLSADAGAYTLPTASTTTLGGVKFQSQVNDFMQIEESQLFREGLVISRGMHIGSDGVALISAVKLNGTTLSSEDYQVSLDVLTLGGSSLLFYRCMMDYGLTFYFEDERTITAGSTLEFTISDMVLPGQGIVLGTSALTQNFTPFACGFYSGGESLTVYVDKDTKLLQIAGSGLGLDNVASS